MPHVHGLGYYCRVSRCSSANFFGMMITMVVFVSLMFAIPGNVMAADENTAVKSDTKKPGGEIKSPPEERTGTANLEGDHEYTDKSLKELKLQIEEIAIQLYEIRANDLERFKQVEEAVGQINGYLKDMVTSMAMKQRIAGSDKDAAAAHTSGSVAVDTAEFVPGESAKTKTASLPTPNMSGYARPLETMLAAVLVFLAPLGFSLLEASRTEQTAVPRIFLRNLMVTAIMLLTFATAGSWISYGQSLLVSIGASGNELAPNGEPNDTFWLYHLEMTIMVGLIANTILSDRISLRGHGVMALLLGLLVHPLIGRLVWMGHWLPEHPGWLEGMGFLDYAGATAIHSTGVWFSLAWLWRFPAVRPLQDSTIGNPVYALLALFILWLNWFGLAMGYQHIDIQLMALPIINVSLAGATAILVSFMMTLNRLQTAEANTSLLYFRLVAGVLGGLVAISAGVDRFTPIEAIFVGGIAGVLHTYAYRWLSTTYLKQDHIAAALVATHGICGIWGTLCLGFMGSAGSFNAPELMQLGIQSLGIVVALALGLLSGLLGALPFQLLSGSKVIEASPATIEGASSLAQEINAAELRTNSSPRHEDHPPESTPAVTTATAVIQDDAPAEEVTAPAQDEKPTV